MKTKLLVMCLFLGVTIAHSQVYVDASATGNNDGTSWADAYNNLQSALNSNPAGTFWIKAGTYIPGANRTDSFNLTNNQKLYGGFNGAEVSLSQRNPVVNITILSGDINGNDNTLFSASDPNRVENSYRIINVSGDGVVIDGFNINNGNANGSATTEKEGSAVSINISSSLKINNCKFMYHTLTRGGVIRTIDVAPQVNLEITNSIFKDNESSFATVYYGRANGNLDIKLEGCLFSNNISLSTTGSLIWLRQDISGSQSAEIINSTFSDNSLDSSRAIIDKLNISGGTVICQIYNSIFWNNGDGTGDFSDAVESGTSGSVVNSISNNSFTSSSSTSNVSNTNPLFTDSVNGDYTLQSSSPAIDSGDNTKVSASILTDLTGNQRIFNTTVDMGPYEFGSNTTTTAIVYVNANAAGANNGTSWSDAFTSLKNAVDNYTNVPVDFWIAAGTYLPGNINTQSIEPGQNHKFYGGFNGTETQLSERDFIANRTYINGDINGDDSGSLEQNNTSKADNTYRLFQVYNDGVLFDGLVFVNAFALGSTANGSIERMGSAIYASHEFQVQNCEFYDNLSYNGGVIQMQQQTSGANHNIKIYNSIFQDNFCGDGVITTSNGTSTSLNLEIEGSLITDNFFSRGLISANAARNGVNMVCNITNTTIANNETDNAINFIQVLRNRIGSNSSCAFNIENSIIWNNFTAASGTNQSVRLNGLSNGDTSGGGTEGVATLGFSIAESTIGATSTNNTSSNNPLFVAATDYTLQAASPAVDEGDNQYVTLSEDLLGNARIYGSAVDMGAYEFGSSLSIADVEVNITEVKLYPNPASNIINIISNHVNIKSVGIYDVLGKQVLAKTNKKDINVSDLRSGMYIVKIEFENNTSTSKRFIKL
ncbi:T9SS type A sorting domain-containing protein [uncultured Winogradskyella sp.]|uniref:T9SS type A sorting domain-containing protein n=1 Tax=uncultured Winogradskyella sp. TaxID=395353 RepID=UPI00262FF233|nr:T9SS type A sorting domain-containing protein [uncultured Winogradskyella sp.]